MWFPPQLFARMITSDEPRPGAGTRDLLWALYYFYGHAELEDGPGRGLEVIDPAMRETLGPALKDGCSADAEAVLGNHRPSEVFARPFLDALRTCEEGGACSAEASRWLTRFARDWPELDGKGPPVLWIQGARDGHVTPARVRCAMDRITAAMPKDKLTLCGEQLGTHTGAFLEHFEDVMTWIGQEARGQGGELSCDAEPLRQEAASEPCPVDARTR
jgi:pimeloyl-ACP methyl ester carboxylesterase